MIGLKNAAAALALSLAVVAAASPASAAQKRISQQARAAHAQAVEGSVESANGGVAMNKAREDAIRDCSGQMNRLVQKDWGVMQDEKFSSCMVEHGQAQ